MLIENMSMAFASIRANKMRSFLTMLGIIIGIGSVIAIVSIGDSMRNMVAGLYKDIGVTRAIVYTDWELDDYRMSDAFTLDEIDSIKEAFGDEIKYINNRSTISVDAVNGHNKDKLSLEGIDYNFTNITNVNIIYGRMLEEGDIKGRKNNAVIEQNGAQKLFGTDNAVGKSFRMTFNGNISEYTVVGVYKKEITIMQAMLMGSGQTDEGYIPYTLLTNPNDFFSNIDVTAREGTDMEAFSLKMRTYIANLHGRKPENIVFYAVADEMGSMDSLLNGMSAAVGGIAAISLLVGGIGIMNIMLVSVTERTREIGIRKALGATTRDVLIQFLTESAILSACGGVIGVIIGVGIVMLGGALLGIQVIVRPSVVIIAVSFSAVVGIFFGLYPASKAAKKDPIDALRYE